MNKLVFILISYIFAIAFCFTFATSVVDSFDEEFIAGLEIYEEAEPETTQETSEETTQAPEITKEAQMIQSLFAVFSIIAFFIHIVYFVLCMVIVKDNSIQTREILFVKGEKPYNIFRIILYIISVSAPLYLGFIYALNSPDGQSSTINLLSQVLLLMNCYIFGIWIINFVKIKKGLGSKHKRPIRY